MHEEPWRIGWIGFGKMGVPICHRLHNAGFEISVHARNEAGFARAMANDLPSVGDLAELVERSDIIMAAITDDAALLDIVGGQDALAEAMTDRQIFVDTSTVSPKASSQAGEMLSKRDIPYLRAPVSGSTQMAAAGTLSTIVSGPKEAYERLAPVFSSFVRQSFYLGDGEQARFMKLALNAMVAATSALLAESLAVARKGGLENATALDVISQSAVASPLIGYKRDMIVAGDYEPAFSVSQMLKDLNILLAVGQSEHCPLPVSAQIRQQYEAAYARGLGEQDFFALVRGVET